MLGPPASVRTVSPTWLLIDRIRTCQGYSKLLQWSFERREGGFSNWGLAVSKTCVDSTREMPFQSRRCSSPLIYLCSLWASVLWRVDVITCTSELRFSCRCVCWHSANCYMHASCVVQLSAGGLWVVRLVGWNSCLNRWSVVTCLVCTAVRLLTFCKVYSSGSSCLHLNCLKLFLKSEKYIRYASTV